jgi:hypothetical protein
MFTKINEGLATTEALLRSETARPKLRLVKEPIPGAG